MEKSQASARTPARRATKSAAPDVVRGKSQPRLSPVLNPEALELIRIQNLAGNRAVQRLVRSENDDVSTPAVEQVGGVPVQQTQIQRDPSETEPISDRGTRIKQLAGDNPDQKKVYDAYVSVLKGDGFKYISSSKGGTDVFNGTNEAACASIVGGLKKAFLANIPGLDPGELIQVKNVYVPLSGNFIDASAVGNVVNDQAYYFPNHWYLNGFDPTAGMSGSLTHDVQISEVEDRDAYIDGWIKNCEIDFQQKNEKNFYDLKGKISWIRQFSSFFLIGKKGENRYYKVPTNGTTQAAMSEILAKF